MNTGALISKQNPDGGWPYVRGKSRTEPTAYAVMALLAAGEDAYADRGIRWIASIERPEGGWPTQVGVDQSAWVTALVALLPPERLGAAAHARAIRWLVATVGEESTFFYRARQWLLGAPLPPEQRFAGWPWVPGAAAWVGPTSVAILALEQEARRSSGAGIRERIANGRQYLLDHVCVNGGWNYGSARPLGYESNPYPETTGMALAALRGVSSPKVDRSLNLAHQFLSQCRSADALNWLRLGLLAHGQLPAGFCPPSAIAYRTVPESSLDLLVAATAGGTAMFWA